MEILAVPDAPVVVVGVPSHFSIVPEMPPQMLSRATFISWDTRVVALLVHVVPLMAAGFTLVFRLYKRGAAKADVAINAVRVKGENSILGWICEEIEVVGLYSESVQTRSINHDHTHSSNTWESTHRK